MGTHPSSDLPRGPGLHARTRTRYIQNTPIIVEFTHKLLEMHRLFGLRFTIFSQKVTPLPVDLFTCEMSVDLFCY